MLKEFVYAISDMARNATAPEITPIPGDDRKQIIWCGSSMEVVDKQPPAREHRADTWESLVKAVNEFKGDKPASIWHSDVAIIGVVDDSDRRDTIRFNLQTSELYGTLTGLPRSFDQRQLLTFFKRDLAGAIDPSTVALFRTITFRRQQDGSSVVKHGEESLGRSVEEAVCNSGELPESILVRLPVYMVRGLASYNNVAIDVEVDTTNASFGLKMLPDELNTAMQLAQFHIHKELLSAVEGDETIRIFAGTP